MNKLLPAEFNWPLHSAASSRAIEAAGLAELPTHILMERAGTSVARLSLALAPAQGPIWIVCGPGNNGGDGLVAARLLHANGQQVRVSLVGHRPDHPLPDDAQAALCAAQQAGVRISAELEQPPTGTQLVIDALLGLGLNRAPAPAFEVAIAALNALSAPVLAVDLPSGLLADSGALGGSLAVQARHTLSLLTLKPGLFTALGRPHCGEIWFDDLAVHTSLKADATLLGAQTMRLGTNATPYNHAKHKGSQGDVLVLGGAAGMRGAARLAARAALAAGAGRVYVCLLGQAAEDAKNAEGAVNTGAETEADSQRPELMRYAQQRLNNPVDWHQKILVCGCGAGPGVAELLPTLLEHGQRLVLDADALNAIAASAALQTLLGKRQSRGLATALTPHPLEAARLLACDTAEIQANRLAAAQQLSAKFNSTVILKGSGSIVASPDRLPAINSSGTAALATAGSGDVLAGWLGGLWAQHPDADPHALACAACFWHGRAAERQSAGPLRAADLVERMHALHPLAQDQPDH
ncbi:NAD(P)H-hydrate dehydratase [Paucibacter sp. AS339]|uniref:NAD(P)H-hydrate dehydratase n=1 Tax=Paucibacter hankyongi TaxID=3133434 RepID=UPI00309A43DA